MTKPKLLLTAALAASIPASIPAAWATDVGVSISVAQPGLYGRIDIGSVPAPPVLVYPRPVVIVPQPVAQPPIYMHVPPGHAKDWGKHCEHYGACGYPVYFVSDGWYQTHYVPAQAKGHRQTVATLGRDGADIVTCRCGIELAHVVELDRTQAQCNLVNAGALLDLHAFGNGLEHELAALAGLAFTLDDDRDLLRMGDGHTL